MAKKVIGLGLEVDLSFQLSEKWNIRPNFTLSENKNIDFVNGATLENLGNTTIAFSPSVIGGNILAFKPIQSVQIAWLSKFVGNQYMNNIDSKESKLPDYFVNDFNITYELNPKSIFKSIIFTGLVNNFLDKKYVSNGADYGGGYVYYYPQAGINFLAGLTLKF